MPPDRRQVVKRVGAVVRAAFLKDLALKSVALLLALLFWGSLQLVEDTKETIELELMVAPPPGHVVVGDALRRSQVTVTGPVNDIKNYQRSVAERPIHLNASEYGLGRTSVYLNKELLGLPRHLRTVAIRPSMITFFVDKEATRVVAVKPQLQGDPSAGLTVTSVHATPSRLTIRGPASKIETLDHVVAGPIDIAGAVNSISTTAAVRTEQPGVSIVDLAEVQVAVEINAPLKERRMAGLVVEPGERFQPNATMNLRLKGPKDSLTRLRANDLRLRLDESSVQKGAGGRWTARVLVEGLPQGVIRLGSVPRVDVRRGSP